MRNSVSLESISTLLPALLHSIVRGSRISIESSMTVLGPGRRSAVEFQRASSDFGLTCTVRILKTESMVTERLVEESDRVPCLRDVTLK